MREQFANYTLDKINDDLIQMLDGKVVNEFKLFVMKEESTKLSVTLKPVADYDEKYHGLHPMFDEMALRKFLEEKDVNKSSEFWECISRLQVKEEKILFDLILEDEEINRNDENLLGQFNLDELKEVLLGRSVLQMMSHYGIIVKYTNLVIKEEFDEDFNRICKSLKLDKNLYIHKANDDPDDQEKFVGIWPIELIRRVQKKYNFIVNNNRLELLRCEGQSDDNLLTRILTFQDMNFFQFISGGVYYSGVMPRVMGIECKNNQTSNSSIKQLSFKVCRTTFSTVDMMDNSEVINHYFFTGQAVDTDRRKMMDAFNAHEDEIQLKYLYEDMKEQSKYDQRAYEDNEIVKINEYLKQSLNTHTIAVSCNIRTTDNFLIAAQRDDKSIDAGEFYCSANGQSEFMDKNVTFYKESVFEDLPSMNYNSEYRVDLNNEIRREVIAELGITSIDAEWKYLGVSYLAINRTKKNNNHEQMTKRRMHFNVLALNKTSLDFKSVVMTQKHATENFENSKVIGIQTVLLDSPFELISKTSKFLYDWINRNKSRIFLILFFLSVVISRNEGTKLTMNNIVDITLLSIYLLLTIYDFIKNSKYRKLRFIKRFYLPFYYRKSSLNVKKLMNHLSRIGYSSKHFTFHGIFILMYLMTLIHED